MRVQILILVRERLIKCNHMKNMSFSLVNASILVCINNPSDKIAFGGVLKCLISKYSRYRHFLQFVVDYIYLVVDYNSSLECSF